VNSSNLLRVSFGALASRFCSCFTFASCGSRRCNAPEPRPVTRQRPFLKPRPGGVILRLFPRIQLSRRPMEWNSLQSAGYRASNLVDPRDKPEDHSGGDCGRRRHADTTPVIPAKAGIHASLRECSVEIRASGAALRPYPSLRHESAPKLAWMPASAGMTGRRTWTAHPVEAESARRRAHGKAGYQEGSQRCSQP
jgi:hypothetical protein